MGKTEQAKAREAAIPPAGISRDPGEGFRPMTKEPIRQIDELVRT